MSSTPIRWLAVALGAVVVTMGVASVAGVGAAPAQDIVCTWSRLDTGQQRTQHVLTYVPDSVGAYLFAGQVASAQRDSLSNDLHFLPMSADSSHFGERKSAFSWLMSASLRRQTKWFFCTIGVVILSRR